MSNNNSVERIYKGLMNFYTRDSGDLLMRLKKEGHAGVEKFKTDALKSARELFSADDISDINVAVSKLTENLFGYSVLTSAIKDKTVSDIKVHDWNKIVIKRKGKKFLSDISFNSPEEYKRFIESVTTRNKVNISNVNAIRRFTDNDTDGDSILRFTLVTPYLTTNENYELIIRKVPKNFPELEDLSEDDPGMLSPQIANYLKERLRNGSMLICGANSSGKTTILNALKEKIPTDKSVLVLQQAEELTTKNHPDMIFLHSVEGNGESDTRYDLKDLSIAGLTMDIDYFIIGETKGAEAAYLLNASYTGHICATTIHAYSSQSALDKLVDYVKYTSDYSKKELMAMLSNFKTVIFMKDYKVEEISEVNGFNEEISKMDYTKVFSRSEGINDIDM
ncbi:ATPase, T2SS/T4P/T4SS family [Lachnospira multipara]|uniref:ATPase, T2SS/T4P/T4SS family n=1 Tax=Lachnospira multipara TaxID=28051 RepID=UPI00047F1B46|nr:ATPase, T2SS/T4P/T4SS family [Lachnospira multipara]